MIRWERWWWLAAFCLASLLLHLTLGAGTRAFNFGLPRTIAAAPPPAEIEVALAVPTPVERVRPKTAPATPRKPAAPRVRRQNASAPTRIVAPAPVVAPPRVAPQRPVEKTPSVVVPVPRPSTRFTPTVSLPMALGVRDGDRTLKPDMTTPATPLPRPIQTPPRRTLETIGRGGGGGLITEGVPAEDAPSPGSGTDAVGAGPGRGGGVGGGVGKATGEGSGAFGQGKGGPRGVPFGDPNGVPGGSPFGGGGGAGGGAGAGGGGPIHAVYVLDVSGSMLRDDRIGHAKAALREALRELRPGDTFAVVTFSSDARAFSPQFGPATPEAIRQAIQRLGLIIIPDARFGLTNYSAALEAATKFRGATHIFFITDGEPTAGVGVPPTVDDPIDDEAIRAFFRERNRDRASIYTFFIGDAQEREGMKLLRLIAAESGGLFRYVDVRPRN
jgi:hypothetical protein